MAFPGFSRWFGILLYNRDDFFAVISAQSILKSFELMVSDKSFC